MERMFKRALMSTWVQKDKKIRYIERFADCDTIHFFSLSLWLTDYSAYSYKKTSE